MKKTNLIVLVLSLFAFSCSAETIIVDSNGFADFDNVQDAINYSWDGDIVIVRPGTYIETIYFNGRAVTLTSEDPNDPDIVGRTILTKTTSPVISFNFGEYLDSVLTGFTIEGGITCLLGASPTITKNIIKPGGSHGILNAGGNISNNIISGSSGRGIDTIKNCTIFNNTITENADYGIIVFAGNAIVKNNIIVNNGGAIHRPSVESGDCQNSFNCFWGNNFGMNVTPGLGDIYIDPLFADSDCRLKSAAGRWDPVGETWLIDDANSRCIDAGDPCSPIGFELNPNGGRVNLGAYGCTAQASKSTSGIIEPVCTIPPSADLTGDCKVNLLDFTVMAAGWLDCGLDPQSACWE